MPDLIWGKDPCVPIGAERILLQSFTEEEARLTIREELTWWLDHELISPYLNVTSTLQMAKMFASSPDSHYKEEILACGGPQKDRVESIAKIVMAVCELAHIQRELMLQVLSDVCESSATYKIAKAYYDKIHRGGIQEEYPTP